jgi:hypothetical protein
MINSHLPKPASYSNLRPMEATLQSFNLAALINRFKLVVLSPKECWKTISSEDHDPKALVMSVILPLVVVGIVCSTIGLQVFGISMGPLGTWRPPLVSFLLSQVVNGVMTVVGVFVSAWLIQKLASFFHGSATPSRAFSLVTHAMLPLLASNALTIFPPLTVLGLVLLILSLYTLYQGSSVMTTVPENKRLGFVVSFIACAILVSIVFAAISAPIIGTQTPPLPID